MKTFSIKELHKYREKHGVGTLEARRALYKRALKGEAEAIAVEAWKNGDKIDPSRLAVLLKNIIDAAMP